MKVIVKVDAKISDCLFVTFCSVYWRTYFLTDCDSRWAVRLHMWSDGLKLMRNYGRFRYVNCSKRMSRIIWTFDIRKCVCKVRRLFARAVWTICLTCLATIPGVLQIPVDRSRLWDSLFHSFDQSCRQTARQWGGLSDASGLVYERQSSSCERRRNDSNSHWLARCTVRSVIVNVNVSARHLLLLLLLHCPAAMTNSTASSPVVMQ